jgi:predicted hydrocarbon binding protein
MKTDLKAGIPARVFRQFVDVLNAEMGAEMLATVLETSHLPADLANPQTASRYNSATAAQAYAEIQSAMRQYYGRGARGTLHRMGRLMWGKLLETASVPEKAQAQIIRSLPLSMRAKPALELLAHILRQRPGEITLHTLDLDLMLVDRASPATLGQPAQPPLCHITLGLIQETLFWATGREHDVEETACRANGSDDCEFKIHTSQIKK